MDPVILVFAGLAAFFIFKLLSALGENNGEADSKSDAGNEIEALRRTLSNGLKNRQVQEADTSIAGDDEGASHEAPTPVTPVRAVSPAGQTLQDADPNFSEKAFIDGARSAYELIVESFAEGDMKSIRQYLSDSVYNAFQSAVDARKVSNHSQELQFVGIDRAEIVEATVGENSMTAVTDFTSNQVRVTRDAEGNVVDGDPNRIDLVRDRWTFIRKRHTDDPNWILVATAPIN